MSCFESRSGHWLFWLFVDVLVVVVMVLLRIVSKTLLRSEYSRCFYLYSLSQHVSSYLMAILRRIAQNIKRSCYFYNGSIVLSIIMCVSCRQVIVVVFLYAIKNILNIRCEGRIYSQTLITRATGCITP
jgi:hypothetical protein